LAEYAEELGRTPSLSEFVEHFGLDTHDVYRPEASWTRLRRRADLGPPEPEPDEDRLTAGLRRFQHVDDAGLIHALLSRQTGGPQPDLSNLGAREHRQLLMAHFSLWGRDSGISSLDDSFRRLRTNPAHTAELVELLHFKLTRVASVPPTATLPFHCPLALHASYTRDEILASLGVWSLQARPEMREGVKHLPALPADIFLFTLNKTEKDYSPTTMYQDYALSDSLIHWQSQSTTSDRSETGRRYIEHRARGHTILLFARENKHEHGQAAPYSFLGPADYVSHEGSRPMSVTWHLRHPLPARLLRRFQRLAV
jgi:hypothetical protein